MSNSGQEIVNAFHESRNQLKQALVDLVSFGRKACNAEYAYRLRFRQEFFRLHYEDGVAWTACADLARGEPDMEKDGKLVRGCASLRLSYYTAKTEHEASIEKINCIKTELRFLETEINEALGRGVRR